MATATQSVAGVGAANANANANANASGPGSGSNPEKALALPIYDAFLDLPSPGMSTASNVNSRRTIIAPPAGEAFSRSRDVGVELATDAGIARVASFCFPEFRPDQESARNAAAATETNPSSPGLNKFDINAKDYYFDYQRQQQQQLSSKSSSSTSASSFYSFAMQLSTGQRVYGHVRRYLPHHPVAKSRIDVGRRGVRAMVILTRVFGGESFYYSLLKTLEAITSHRSSITEQLRAQARPQQRFLHHIHNEHTKLASLLTNNPNVKITPQSSTIYLDEMEAGNPNFKTVDYCKFAVPPSILMPHDPTQSSESPILPLLRCVGIAHALRLFSALMCERRIILVSQSPTRLSACAAAATSILSQGLLHWQHIYIPILPFSMMNYLAAPMPYLIGVTANHAGAIEQIAGLGEVLVVYLDQNQLQTHNMTRPDMFIPDILVDNNEATNGYGGNMEPFEQRRLSIADILKMDLINVVKMDKKVMEGSGGSGTTAAVAGKGKEILKKGVGKLKNLKNVVKKQSKQLNKSNHGGGGNTSENDTPDDIGDATDRDIYAFSEGYENFPAEEEIRITFANFFLALIGDMKTYLVPPSASEPPKFDKEMFLRSRQKQGDQVNSPLHRMLAHFKESQLFEQFVLARITEFQERIQPSSVSSIFIRALRYHNTKRIPFNSSEVRRTSQQHAARSYGHAPAHNARSRAIALTSNNRGDASQLSRLVQDCRESSVFLVEVMGVVWERIADSRGMQWKHGYYALQMMKELLLHGPIGAVTEATEGIDKIRKLKYYENNMRPQVMQDIRMLAFFIYQLLINRTQLFTMRRVCAVRRMEMLKRAPSRLQRKQELRSGMRFNVAHALLKPGAGAGAGAVAAAHPGDVLAATAGAAQTGGLLIDVAPMQNQSYSDDLLSMDFATAPVAAPAVAPTAAPMPAASGGHAIASFAQPTTDALGQALTSTTITPGPPTVPSSASNTGALPTSPQFGAPTIAQIPNHPPTNQQHNMYPGTHSAGHQMQQVHPQPSHQMQPQQGFIQNAGQQMNPSSTPVQPAPGTHSAGHQMQQVHTQPNHQMQPQQGIIQNAGGQQMNPSSTPVQPAAQYKFDPFS